MKTYLFEKSTILDAPVAAVYAFHENPHNVGKISPASFHVHRIEANPEAVEGEIFTLAASQFLVPIRWRAVWDRAEHPTLLADRALQSPFARFRHEHRFESIDTGRRTRMTDHLEYALPGGCLGDLFARTAMRVFLAILFAARHRATRDYFTGSVVPRPIRSPLRRLGGWLAFGLLLGTGIGWAWNRRRR